MDYDIPIPDVGNGTVSGLKCPGQQINDLSDILMQTEHAVYLGHWIYLHDNPDSATASSSMQWTYTVDEDTDAFNDLEACCEHIETLLALAAT